MVFLFSVIVILSIFLCVSIIYGINAGRETRRVKRMYDQCEDVNRSLIYDNCVLTDKIEKIRDLNLIDCTGNDYYRELLTTKID